MSCQDKKRKYRKREPLDVELDSWHRRWVLMEQTVYCVGCHQGQDASDAAHAFVHAHDCGLKVHVFQYPWHELRSALRYLPKVNL
jgi:hypothetical protein